jgi:MFS family permease
MTLSPADTLPHATPAPPPISPQRAIAAATIGNALEFYDFISYAFFAIQIGHAFFPAQSAYGSLMLSLATFGAGFVTRPFGGLVIGAFSDRVGRRAGMMLSFTLMGVATVAMAVIPTYARIGLAAPALAILARMVMGFALGGEVGPTTAYLLESAAVRNRGLSVAMQGASQSVASAAAGLVGFILAAVLSAQALDEYGWRIAFALGAVTIPFGLWVRRSLPETLHAVEPVPSTEVTPSPLGGATRLEVAIANRRIIILGLAVLAAGTIRTYVANYMTTFAQDTLHMAKGPAFIVTVAGSVAMLFGALVGGGLSDRIGRRSVMIWPNLATLLMTYPVFLWIVTVRSPLALLTGVSIMGFVSSIASGGFYVALAESLPKPIRGMAFSTIYAISIALFGGTCQLVIQWLIHRTGNPMSPAWYLLAATTMGQIAMQLIPESAPVRLAVAAENKLITHG